MFRFLKRLLFGAAFLLGASILIAAERYPSEAKSTRTTVTVNIQWLASLEAVNRFCSMLMGYPIPTNGRIAGCYQPGSQTIFAAEPRSFNDGYRLEILGHEFWHALGAEHPEL